MEKAYVTNKLIKILINANVSCQVKKILKKNIWRFDLPNPWPSSNVQSHPPSPSSAMQLSISTSAIADIVAADLNHMLVDRVSQNFCELYLIQSCVSSTLHYMDTIIERSYRPSSRSTQWGDLARNFTGHGWVSMLGLI